MTDAVLREHLDRILRASSTEGALVRLRECVTATSLPTDAMTASLPLHDDEIQPLIDEIVSCADDADGGRQDAARLCQRLVARVRASVAVPAPDPCIFDSIYAGTCTRGTRSCCAQHAASRPQGEPT